MKEKGLLSGMLLSKLGVAIAAFLLIASVLTFNETFRREQGSKRLEYIVESVSESIRETCSLPGHVRLRRDIPSGEGSYNLVILGKREKEQLVKVFVEEENEISQTLLLGRQVNEGEFRIEKENPHELAIRKTDRIELEVV